MSTDKYLLTLRQGSDWRLALVSQAVSSQNNIKVKV